MEHLSMTYSEMQLVKAAINAALSANTAELSDLQRRLVPMSNTEVKTHLERHRRNQGKLFAVGDRLDAIMTESIDKWESEEE
jgi:hypothetical protein